MEKRGLFGYSIFTLGLLIFFIKPITGLVGLTGFAIALTITSIFETWFYALGTMFMLTGISFVLMANQNQFKNSMTLEDYVSYICSANDMNPIEHMAAVPGLSHLNHLKPHPILVIDSTFLMANFPKDNINAHNQRKDYLRDLARKGYSIIIPKGIEEENKGLKSLNHNPNYSRNRDYNQLKREIEQLIKNTPKYHEGLEILESAENFEDIKKIRKMHTNYSASKYLKESLKCFKSRIKSLGGWAISSEDTSEHYKALSLTPEMLKIRSRKEWAIALSKGEHLEEYMNRPEIWQKFKQYVRKRYLAVSNDAELIATAVYSQKENPRQPTILVSSDRSIADAIEQVKSKYPELTRNLFYSNPNNSEVNLRAYR
jgi:hypothetical protein